MVKNEVRGNRSVTVLADEGPFLPPTNPEIAGLKGAPDFGCRKGGVPASINHALCATSEENQLNKEQLAELAGTTVDRVVTHLTVWHPETGVKGNRGVAAYLKQNGDRWYLRKQ